jgi:hypothetical protein
MGQSDPEKEQQIATDDDGFQMFVQSLGCVGAATAMFGKPPF